LPTKTEQSDLHTAVFGGSGDAARIVIAPTNVLECYHYTVHSFQLAEKYQTPTVVLTDFFLDNRVENVAVPKASKEEIADGNIYPEASEKGNYRRFADTESGISPRSIPGMEGLLFTTTGLEHTETGEPDYTSANHMLMSEKRHRKVYGALKDLPQPQELRQHAQLDVGVIAWGSTFGSALEAVKKAQQKDLKVGALKVTSIFPYHADLIRGFMDRCAEIIIPELNFEGQLANLIGHLHRKDVLRLNQASGIPMSPNTILTKIESLL
jgi:2-oxoglutarate ferredoxin oxidoreductase subunit alpha